jgi:hypothetical protein
LLTKAISVQGIFRIAPASAADLDAVLEGPSPERRATASLPAAGQEMLF